MSYPNSDADEHLNAITKRLGGEIADDFWGFTAYGARIHYHHGCGGERCNGTYPQYTWEKPFDIDGLDVDYVLLEAPSAETLTEDWSITVTEDFFLIPMAEVKDLKLTTVFPKDLNIAADPHHFKGTKKNARVAIWDCKMTCEQVKEKLVDFEWAWSLDF
jgi:hypothetical protein